MAELHLQQGMTGDQISPENGPSPRPWERSGWLKPRLLEMIYTLLSWPYSISLSLTVFFFLRPDAITLQAMLAGWTLAFARREFAAFMQARGGATITRTETKAEGKG